MTFIVTAASTECVIQVADTLLSANGKPCDDKLVKSTIVHCLNGKLAISYTGVACLDGTRTDLWLTRHLAGWNSWKKSFPDLVEFISNELTNAVARNPYLSYRNCGLTVVVAGLARLENGRLWPAIAEVTNFQRPVQDRMFFQQVPPMSSFSKWFLNLEASSPYFISINGAMSVRFNWNPYRRKIAKFVQRATTLENQIEIARLMVSMLREHRVRGRLEGVVGSNCTVAIIQNDLRSVSSFYSQDGNALRRLPNIVAPEGQFENLIVP